MIYGKRIIILTLVFMLLVSTISVSAQAADLRSINDKTDSVVKMYIRLLPGNIVDEGEIFKVVVMADKDPVPEARVFFNDQIKLTDSQGMVSFLAPEVNSDTNYPIFAEKEGYGPAETTILVLDVPPVKLQIEAPEVVNEHESFDARVTAEGVPIKDAMVIFSSTGYSDIQKTNPDGIVTFTAPEVDSNTQFGICADKAGYESAEKTILVNDVPLSLKMTAPAEVLENSGFSVLVEDQFGNKISGAIVKFNQESDYTDENGIASFVSPELDDDTQFLISASKYNYASDSCIILVKNVLPQIIISAQDSVLENEVFSVSISAEGRPLGNATVVFNGESAYTDSQGLVSFTAPQVGEHEEFIIFAEKEGYKSAQEDILVKNLYTISVLSSKDTQITPRRPGNNYGDREIITVRNNEGYSGGPWRRDVLVGMDISSIPSSVTIVSAKLKLYYKDYDDSCPAGRVLTLYRLNNNWIEDEVNWDNRPTMNDQISSSAIVPNQKGTWMSFDVTSDVQNMVLGSISNFGWELADEEDWGYGNIPITKITSKEYGSFIPYLEIVLDEDVDMNQAPIADFSYDVVGNLSVDFTDLSIDLDGSIASRIWFFGDGEYSTEQNPIHIYPSEGTYNVVLCVEDDDGAQSNISKSVTIQVNLPPIADFSFNTDDLTVYFQDESEDPDGSIVGRLWDFGDGVNSTLENPIHNYSSDGNYSVTLTVFDNNLEQDSITKMVLVSDSQTSNLVIIPSKTVVDEYERFYVFVKDDEGNYISNATVTFAGETNYTNEYGFMWWVAPGVDSDTNFTIHAEKIGYESDTKNIHVKNVYLMSVRLDSKHVPEYVTFKVCSVSDGEIPWENVSAEWENGTCENITETDGWTPKTGNIEVGDYFSVYLGIQGIYDISLINNDEIICVCPTVIFY